MKRAVAKQNRLKNQPETFERRAMRNDGSEFTSRRNSTAGRIYQDKDGRDNSGDKKAHCQRRDKRSDFAPLTVWRQPRKQPFCQSIDHDNRLHFEHCF
jgi:hypothetical protein